MNTGWLFAGLGLVGLFAIFYLVMSLANGFGEATEAWADYGERPRGRPIQQPTCFWSDLGFVLVGLIVLFWIDMTPRGNVMATASVYSVIFGMLSVWLGPGSMLEHGTLSRPWGWFDASSIHWWSLFTLLYLIAGWILPPARLLEPLVIGLVIGSWLVVAALIGILTARLEYVRKGMSIGLMVALALALVVDGTHVFTNPPARQWGYIVAAGIGLAFGIGALLVGERRGNAPARVSGAHGGQWHGVWHVLTAVSVLFVFVYLRS
jgi:hypothetical protein